MILRQTKTIEYSNLSLTNLQWEGRVYEIELYLPNYTKSNTILLAVMASLHVPDSFILGLVSSQTINLLLNLQLLFEEKKVLK